MKDVFCTFFAGDLRDDPRREQFDRQVGGRNFRRRDRDRQNREPFVDYGEGCRPKTPSVRASITIFSKEAAWDNINIAEVISTTNEFTVVIGDEDIHRAFTILMEAKRQVGV